MHMLKRFIPAIIIIALLIIYFGYEKKHATPDPSRIQASGYIEGHEVRLSSLTGGRLLELYVDEGDYVKISDTIARFDTDQLILKKQELAASRKAAESLYTKLMNGAREDELSSAYQAYLAAKSGAERLREGYRNYDIAPIRAKLAGAEASLEKARSDFERMKYLYQQEVISLSEYESSEMAVEVATSNRDAIRDEIERMERGISDLEIEAAEHEAEALMGRYQELKKGARSEDLNTAEAEIERISAAIAAIDDLIDEATILAPSEGYIRDLILRPGDIVGPLQPVATLVELTDQWVTIYIPAYRLDSISLGMKVMVYPDTLDGKMVEGEISYISPTGEFTPRNIQTQSERANRVFSVRVSIAADADLKPGMGCEVVIPLD